MTDLFAPLPQSPGQTDEGERVAILLSTYNGEPYLQEQLDSLYQQQHRNWTIHVSDDGSQDRTLEIVRDNQARIGADRLTLRNGPRQGFSANFLSLLRAEEIQAPYFAFCDQDDLWNPEKLSNALTWLTSVPMSVPALYCSRTRLIDSAGQPIGFSPPFQRPPSFANALVQSIAGGNTMVMNQAARNLLALTPPRIPIVSHDWWAYLLVSGCGGRILYEPLPQVDYRQHGSNLMGSNRSLRERLQRLSKMFNGTFRKWTGDNLQALESFENKLTSDSRERLVAFRKARTAHAISRLMGFHRAGIHRQSLLDNIGLATAALLNRI